MALKKKLIYTTTIILIVPFLLLLIFGNYIFPRCFTGDEIFGRDFSSKAKTLGCELSAWGRERTYYSFYIVYEGTTNNLLEIVHSLELKGIKSTSESFIQMDRYKKSGWWVPPSLSSNLSYACFEKELRQENMMPQVLVKCRAELINNTLYIHQTGDIQSLRTQLKNNLNFKHFLL